MTDLVYDYITMGVDMIISAAVLSAVIILLKGSTTLSQYNATQQANADRIEYYREYSMYDCTTKLSSADAKSAITYYKHNLQITIRLLNGTLIYNKPTDGTIWVQEYGSSEVMLDSSDFGDYITSTMTFKSNLYENTTKPEGLSDQGYEGGVIVGILLQQE